MLLDTRNKRVATVYIYIHMCVYISKLSRLVRNLSVSSSFNYRLSLSLSLSSLLFKFQRLANSRERAALYNCDALARESRAKRSWNSSFATGAFSRFILRAASRLHLCARVLDASHPHCDIFPVYLHLFGKLPLPCFLIPAHSKISRLRSVNFFSRIEIFRTKLFSENNSVSTHVQFRFLTRVFFSRSWREFLQFGGLRELFSTPSIDVLFLETIYSKRVNIRSSPSSNEYFSPSEQRHFRS